MPTIKNKEIPIVQGAKYIPKSCIPKRPPSINAVRRRLSKIRGSLSETISQIREEE